MAAPICLAASPEPTPAPTPKPAEITWLEWSDESFARAIREHKPIFLNVEAHWSRTSLYVHEKILTDPEVVAFVNENLTPIRVDRDRRPDIDSRYQAAVDAANSGHSGWPLIVVLYENGEVLFGGSYIKLEDRRDEPGLRSLLKRSLAFLKSPRSPEAITRLHIQAVFEDEKTPYRPAEINKSF
ncbi:MAG TPA: DUF255 domain-containing protein, partial [Candidatus Polarisedimenticolia bacterium]|nr:DUF255 domain-containing protein [Candidatus Polarisedimenticolia bacterium]